MYVCGGSIALTIRIIQYYWSQVSSGKIHRFCTGKNSFSFRGITPSCKDNKQETHRFDMANHFSTGSSISTNKVASFVGCIGHHQAYGHSDWDEQNDGCLWKEVTAKIESMQHDATMLFVTNMFGIGFG